MKINDNKGNHINCYTLPERNKDYKAIVSFREAETMADVIKRNDKKQSTFERRGEQIKYLSGERKELRHCGREAHGDKGKERVEKNKNRQKKSISRIKKNEKKLIIKQNPEDEIMINTYTNTRKQ